MRYKNIHTGQTISEQTYNQLSVQGKANFTPVIAPTFTPLSLDDQITISVNER